MWNLFWIFFDMLYRIRRPKRRQFIGWKSGQVTNVCSATLTNMNIWPPRILNSGIFLNSDFGHLSMKRLNPINLDNLRSFSWILRVISRFSNVISNDLTSTRTKVVFMSDDFGHEKRNLKWRSHCIPSIPTFEFGKIMWKLLWIKILVWWGKKHFALELPYSQKIRYACRILFML